MAYTNYDFYVNKYSGYVVPKSEFNRMSQEASDWLDTITFYRLSDGLPKYERYQTRIKKAVCKIADVLYQMDLAQKQSLKTFSDETALPGNTTGKTTGIITSVSAGSETISFANPQQVGTAAKEWNSVYAAVGNPEKANMILYNAAKLYLTGVLDDNGVPLLYAGM